MILARHRFAWWLGAACVVLALLVLWSLGAGQFPVGLAEVARALGSVISGKASGLAPNVDAVVLQVRAPRIGGALAVGAALSAAGAAYQSLFKNPLVSPDILGVTAGCALGAGVAVLGSLPIGAIQLFAFVGGLAAVGLVRSSPSRLPWVRSARPQRDSRTAHSSSGSWLPAIVAGTAGRATAPPARAASQRSTSGGAKRILAPARV